jgi:hypothetical protein
LVNEPGPFLYNSRAIDRPANYLPFFFLGIWLRALAAAAFSFLVAFFAPRTLPAADPAFLPVSRVFAKLLTSFPESVGRITSV